MSALSPADRAKLVGILGMLASDHDGERASAGLLATRLLKQRGLQWADVISANAPVPSLSVGFSFWRDDIDLATRRFSYLRMWEQQFVASLSLRAIVTAKQRRILAEIAAALRARGMA